MYYEILLKITRDVPEGLKIIAKETGRKAEQIPKNMREIITIRDNLTCQVCGKKDDYGNKHWDIPGDLNIHHIIPNGSATEENLITLCKHCHTIVHHLLFVSGKWFWIPRIM
jgi:5-methylcytosine-specific restriction endonuclease McrA